MSDALPYLIRDAGPGDTGFVVDGWVREMRHSPWTRYVPNDVYIHAQHQLIHAILSAPMARCIVACDRDNPDHLYGCAVTTGSTVVHWVYVKGAYRKLGVGRALLSACFDGVAPDCIICTQAPQAFGDLSAKFPLLYVPYLLLPIQLDMVKLMENAYGQREESAA